MKEKKIRVVAVNGSPRKRWNTATLLQNALDGAASVGANTHLIHLYKYKYQGCVSCFACKKKGGKYVGRCAMKDALTPVLEEVMKADVILLGTPVYMNNISGMLQCFIERLIFPVVSYDEGCATKYKGEKQTAVIYTMNMEQKYIKLSGFNSIMKSQQRYLSHFNGEVGQLISADTYQFKKYDKYDASRFDETHKEEVRETEFPEDCRKAYDLGRRLAEDCRVIELIGEKG